MSKILVKAIEYDEGKKVRLDMLCPDWRTQLEAVAPAMDGLYISADAETIAASLGTTAPRASVAPAPAPVPVPVVTQPALQPAQTIIYIGTQPMPAMPAATAPVPAMPAATAPAAPVAQPAPAAPVQPEATGWAKVWDRLKKTFRAITGNKVGRIVAIVVVLVGVMACCVLSLRMPSGSAPAATPTVNSLIPPGRLPGMDMPTAAYSSPTAKPSFPTATRQSLAPPTPLPTQTPVPPTPLPTQTPVPPTPLPTQTPVPPTPLPTQVNIIGRFDVYTVAKVYEGKVEQVSEGHMFAGAVGFTPSKQIVVMSARGEYWFEVDLTSVVEYYDASKEMTPAIIRCYKSSAGRPPQREVAKGVCITPFRPWKIGDPLVP